MDVGVLSSVHQQLDRQYGSSPDQSSSGQSGSGMTGNKQNEEGGASRPTHYSMPGILHFLQTEWARFEMDRAQWEIDRAELQVARDVTY